MNEQQKARFDTFLTGYFSGVDQPVEVPMEDEQLIDASEAVQYLAQKWGIPSYSMDAFKQLRLRKHIKPALSSKTATFWRKSDLDMIPKPDRSKPRGKRVKKNGDADSSSVLY